MQIIEIQFYLLFLRALILSELNGFRMHNIPVHYATRWRYDLLHCFFFSSSNIIKIVKQAGLFIEKGCSIFVKQQK